MSLYVFLSLLLLGKIQRWPQKLGVCKRQPMANAAAFLLLTKEWSTIPVPQLITTDCGAHWILLTVENGEIVVIITTLCCV